MPNLQTPRIPRRKTAATLCRRILVQLGMAGLPIWVIACVAQGKSVYELTFIAALLSPVPIVALTGWLKQDASSHLRGNATEGRRRLLRQRGVLQTGMVVTLYAGVWFALTTQWPLQLTFTASRPALERLTNRIERGETVRLPVRSGLLTVWYIHKKPCGETVLFTDTGQAVSRTHRPRIWFCGGRQTPLTDRWAMVDYD